MDVRAAAVVAVLAAACSATPATPEAHVDALVCVPAPHWHVIAQCLLQPHCSGVEGCHGCDASHFALQYTGAMGLVGTPVWETAHEDATPPDGGAPMYVRVVPGHPESSYLLWKLTGDPRIIGQRMPLGAAPVAAAWVDAITTWVAGGAPQD